MKKLISILFLGITNCIIAQNSLAGQINDSKTNEPLSGVEIHAPDFHKGTVTDFDGHFTLKNLPNKTIRIVISYIGFKTITKTINLTITNELNITMEESIMDFDEIIISTPFNKLQSQNVMKVEHLSIVGLKKMGASTLIEGLTNIPGVSQISTGTSIGKPVIRGLTGNRVLVYAQGVRLENQQFGDEHGLGLNEAGIGSVEVIKGPASLLYGSDALGGVLYFNPEKFANANEINTEFSENYFSNTQGFNTSTMVKTSNEKWQFLARGTYDTHIDYKTPNDQKVTNTRYNENDFKLGVGFSNDKMSSTFRYNFNHLHLGINDNGITEQTSTRSPKFPKQKVSNHIFSIHNHFFLKDSKLDADFGYLYNDRSEFEDSNDANLQMILKTFNYDFKYHLAKIGRVESILGLQGLFQTNTNKANEILIPNATVKDFGVFSTFNYEWQDNVIQTGIRFDNRKITTESHGNFNEISFINAIDKSFNSVNASIGYKSEPFKKTIFRLNIASGFRAPNLAELTSNGVHEGTNRYEKGNSNLKSEQNIQLDLAFAYKNEHIEFFTNGFYNSINKYIFLSPTNTQIDNATVFNYIQGDANLFGGEIGFHFHPHPLDWLHFESSFETVIGKQLHGDYLPLIPANKINSTLKAEFKIKNWFTNAYSTINLTNTLKQNNSALFETKSKAYNLVNLSFGGTITLKKIKMDININLNNVFNTAYISHLSRLKVDNIYNSGRNFIFGINFTL
jgi:iron complex outermembrane receptor protein